MSKPALVIRVGQQMLDVLDEDEIFEYLDIWWDSELACWDFGATPVYSLSSKVAAALNRMKVEPEWAP